MSDLIKKEQLTGSQKVIVGDKYNDLVLKTLGKVYIQTATKFTLLTDLIKESVDKILQDSSFLIIEEFDSELKNIEYPGDGKFIYTSDLKNLYITLNNGYIPIIASNDVNIDWGNVGKNIITSAGGEIKGLLKVESLVVNQSEFKQPIKISTTDAPLKISSKEMVKNLNAEYLNGKKWDEFTKRKEKETITGEWTFDAESYFNRKVRIKDSLESNDGFQGGFTGFGWRLDSKTNTLTIDNLIVRKVMQVFELVVNRISATNGSLWVSDSAKIKSVSLIVPSGYFINGSNTVLNKYFIDESTFDSNGNVTNYKMIESEYYVNPKNRHDVQYWDAWYEKGTLAEGYDGITSDADGAVTYLNYQSIVYPDYNNYKANHNPEDYKYKLDISAVMPVLNEINANDLVNLYTEYFRNGNYWLVQLEDDYPPFRVNDIIRCQKFTGTSIKYYDAIVLKAVTNEIVIRTADQFTDLKSRYDYINKKWVDIENGSGVDSTIRSLTNPAATDGLVRMGNIINPARQGAIYMTSNEEDSPFIDIMSDLNRPDFGVVKSFGENGKIKNKRPLKVRIGNLDGIYDPVFGPSQPKGFGLYGENIYIKGHLVQVSGEEETLVAVYRGEWDENVKYYYNNQVTHNGSTYACTKFDTHVVGKEFEPGVETEGIWIIFAEKGEDGKKGEDGVAPLYKGEWSSTKEYFYGKAIDVVKYGGIYYLAKKNASQNINKVPGTDTDFWEPFGANFESVATSLLLAQNGTIGNWTFNNGELRSVIKNNDGSSQLILDGGNGDDLGKPNETNDNYSPDYGKENRPASIRLNSSDNLKNISILVENGVPKMKIEGQINKWESDLRYYRHTGTSTLSENDSYEGTHYTFTLSVNKVSYKGGIVKISVNEIDPLVPSHWYVNLNSSSNTIEIRSASSPYDVECVFSKTSSNVDVVKQVAFEIIYWVSEQDKDGNLVETPYNYTEYVNITQEPNPNPNPYTSSDVKTETTLDSSRLRIRDEDYSSVVEIGNDTGIFSNYPGREVLPAETGLSIKACIAGLGHVNSFYNESLGFPDMYKYRNTFTGVYGTSYNSTNFTNKTPHYGGIFFKLFARGLYLETKVNTDSIYNCLNTDVFVKCWGTVNQIVNLPPFPQAGMTLLINRFTKNTVTIKTNSNIKMFLGGNTDSESDTFSIDKNGDTILLIYYEDVYGVITNKFWRIHKINS